MIARYSTKIDGIWYQAGMEIPERGEEAPSPSVSNPVIPEEIVPEVEDEEVPGASGIRKNHNIKTKTDILMMRKDELVQIAEELEMANPEYLTVPVLKDRISSKLGF